MRHSLAGALRRACLAKQASCPGQHGRTVVSFIQTDDPNPDPPLSAEPPSGATGGGRGITPPGGGGKDGEGGGDPPPRPKQIKIKFADGKERTIQHMMATTFWSPDGKPMSAAEFIEKLFGELPELFTNEDELRGSVPSPVEIENGVTSC